MNFFKYLLLIGISLFFVSCSQVSMYSLSKKDNTLSIGQSQNDFIKVNFTDPTYKSSFSRCTSLSIYS